MMTACIHHAPAMKLGFGRLFGKPQPPAPATPGLAVAQLLFEIARADLGVQAAELAAIRRHLGTAFSLSPAALDALLSRGAAKAEAALSLYDSVEAVNRTLDATQKAQLIGALWQVALADGQIDPYEEALLRRLADLLYVPHSVFIREKLRTLGDAV